jgi:transcriptional regulator with XRE-family HTH domain
VIHLNKNKPENRMKMLRELKGHTHEYMAELLNIKRQTYGRYESGDRNISNDTLVKIADILNVSTDYLLGRDTKKVDMINICEEAKSLPKEERKALIEMLEELNK